MMPKICETGMRTVPMEIPNKMATNRNPIASTYEMKIILSRIRPGK